MNQEKKEQSLEINQKCFPITFSYKDSSKTIYIRPEDLFIIMYDIGRTLKNLKIPNIIKEGEIILDDSDIFEELNNLSKTL